MKECAETLCFILFLSDKFLWDHFVEQLIVPRLMMRRVRSILFRKTEPVEVLSLVVNFVLKQSNGVTLPSFENDAMLVKIRFSLCCC